MAEAERVVRLLCLPLKPDTVAPEPGRHPSGTWSAAQRSAACRPGSGVSCDTFFLARIAVELAEQSVAIFLGPVGQVRDEVLDLFAGGFAQGLHAAEIGGVGLDQVGIELMLANELAEAIANRRAPWFPLVGCGGSFFDSGEKRGSADPISSTEQMPMP
jgi:hypothetical protein